MTIELRPTVIKRKNNFRLQEYWHNEREPFYLIKTPDCEYIELSAINRKQAIKQFFAELEKGE